MTVAIFTFFSTLSHRCRSRRITNRQICEQADDDTTLIHGTNILSLLSLVCLRSFDYYTGPIYRRGRWWWPNTRTPENSIRKTIGPWKVVESRGVAKLLSIGIDDPGRYRLQRSIHTAQNSPTFLHPPTCTNSMSRNTHEGHQSYSSD